MPNRILHLIVTDYDLKGLVTYYKLDDFFTPKLVEAVNNLKLKPENSAICYTSFSPETLEEMDNADILPFDIWENRTQKYADPYQRLEDHFAFQYSQGPGRMSAEGQVPWFCRIREEKNRKEYSRKIEHWRTFREQFHQLLEGNVGLIEILKVGAIIDCTDHPLMQPFLEDLGYHVQRQ